MATYVAQEVGSSAVTSGFVDRDQKAYSTGLVVAGSQGFVDRDQKAYSTGPVLALGQGKVTRTAKDAWADATQKTIPLPQTALRRPVYGIPLFGGGNLAGGTTAQTVGTNTTASYGPTTGQQWPRGRTVI